MLHKMTLHKVKVLDIAFSPSDKFIVSLGAEDDNSIIVWDVASGNATFRAPAAKASTGLALCLAYSNHDDNTFFTKPVN
jgi:WD40 repeat protein